MTDWQQHYQMHDTPWDKGAAAPPLLEWLGNKKLPGAILVPGCGMGHDIRALSHPRNTVSGLDLAPAAIEGAKKFPKTGNENFLVGDFFHLPETMHGVFDLVFEHTCFCAIEPADRENYINSAIQALRPGGTLLGIFFLNPDHDGGPPFRVSEEELDRLFGKAFEMVKKWRPKSSYPGREGREQMREYVLR